MQIFIDNKGLVLEASFEVPDGAGPFPGVALCHPHPLYGGNMDNNVIMAVSRALTLMGMACLRFNFRGVGRSQGSFANGVGEKEDARAALSFLANREDIDLARIGIFGYSFGGKIALSTGACDDRVVAMAAVSPVVPAGVPDDCAKPKLIICGAEDNMISSADVLKDAEKMAEPKIVELVAGADHFWWGYEDKLAEMIAEFFAKILLHP